MEIFRCMNRFVFIFDRGQESKIKNPDLYSISSSLRKNGNLNCHFQYKIRMYNEKPIINLFIVFLIQNLSNFSWTSERGRRFTQFRKAGHTGRGGRIIPILARRP